MKRSNYFIPTEKNAPQDAEIISHKIMIRGGYIRKLASGIYSLLPLGLKICKRIEGIVRKNMNSAGFQEIFMPVLSTAELWMESGRYYVYGKEMIRLKDRHERDFVLGPTHEEIVTDIVRKNVQSYKELPLGLYQIQTKFRDELRPRFGVMRSREFIMKDAYSFDRNEEEAVATFQKMENAYKSIFSEMKLEYSIVEAQSGPIGGSNSKEFMVHALNGEDTIFSCECGYVANKEKAETTFENQKEDPLKNEMISTPDKKTVEEVAKFMSVDIEKIVKTILVKTDGNIKAMLIRGDRELNLEKVKANLKTDNAELANHEEIINTTGCPVGYAGPVGLQVDIYADISLSGMHNFITGANCESYHLKNVNFSDLEVKGFIDISYAVEGDKCKLCQNPLKSFKGIEVGHIFVLGDKYSKKMNAVFLDEQGKNNFFQMGCYGIGIARTMAAVIEQKFDEKRGMNWPGSIAPFDIEILPLKYSDGIKKAADEIYEELIGKGYDVIMDDRDLNAGIKFAESDLLGVPIRILIGRTFEERGEFEILFRNNNSKSECSKQNLFDLIQKSN